MYMQLAYAQREDKFINLVIKSYITMIPIFPHRQRADKKCNMTKPINVLLITRLNAGIIYFPAKDIQSHLNFSFSKICYVSHRKA